MLYIKKLIFNIKKVRLVVSKLDKLVEKIFSGSAITYKEAEKILLLLGFDLEISSSHHNFRKPGYERTITIKKRKELLPYQTQELRKVLVNHGYQERN
jgi:predicted RNA binding protein YcfA (HicA-like mRNA interferase family)